MWDNFLRMANQYSAHRHASTIISPTCCCLNMDWCLRWWANVKINKCSSVPAIYGRVRYLLILARMMSVNADFGFRLPSGRSMHANDSRLINFFVSSYFFLLLLLLRSFHLCSVSNSNFVQYLLGILFSKSTSQWSQSRVEWTSLSEPLLSSCPSLSFVSFFFVVW